MMPEQEVALDPSAATFVTKMSFITKATINIKNDYKIRKTNEVQRAN